MTPAPLGSGGLGAAASDFFDGVSALGAKPTHICAEDPDALGRLTSSRPFRRFFGMAASRRLSGRATRRAVPARGWDLAYATPGAVPVGGAAGVTVVHQATHLPVLEWEALRRAERETGGRGDLSRAERRRREHELKHADLIHITSLAVRNEFLEAGFAEERIVHAYPGVDLDRYSPIAKSEDLTIAFVGPLSLRKGVDLVADLAARMRGQATIETVGGPTCPWSKRIAARARFVHRESVAEMLAGARVFVLPSRSDGFSYAVLEALASGAVPIVTPAVGAAEIVRRLDPRLIIDVPRFVDGTVELLPELDLERLSKDARDLAKEFDRRDTSRQAARAVLTKAAELSS